MESQNVSLKRTFTGHDCLYRIMDCNEQEKNRIIEMAWEDRTPFEAIFQQFSLREDQVKVLMKRELKFSSYTLWRERVEKCKTKHVQKRNSEIDRFKCTRQRTISHNAIAKR